MCIVSVFQPIVSGFCFIILDVRQSLRYPLGCGVTFVSGPYSSKPNQERRRGLSLDVQGFCRFAKPCRSGSVESPDQKRLYSTRPKRCLLCPSRYTVRNDHPGPAEGCCCGPDKTRDRLEPNGACRLQSPGSHNTSVTRNNFCGESESPLSFCWAEYKADSATCGGHSQCQRRRARSARRVARAALDS